DRRERERPDGEHPTGGRPEAARDDVVDEEERGQAEEETGRGEGPDEECVEPQRRPGDLPEVDEVREDVRRVRQEEEPYDPGRGEQPTRRSGSVETDEPEREQVGHPGEEEVPEEEGEGRRARELGTDVLEAPGQ